MGSITLKKANVSWVLSIDERKIPSDLQIESKKTLRQLMINGERINFNDGFDHLHTLSYEEILRGNGCKLTETKQTIELLHFIRTAKLI